MWNQRNMQSKVSRQVLFMGKWTRGKHTHLFYSDEHLWKKYLKLGTFDVCLGFD